MPDGRDAEICWMCVWKHFRQFHIFLPESVFTFSKLSLKHLSQFWFYLRHFEVVVETCLNQAKTVWNGLKRFETFLKLLRDIVETYFLNLLETCLNHFYWWKHFFLNCNMFKTDSYICIYCNLLKHVWNCRWNDFTHIRDISWHMFELFFEIVRDIFWLFRARLKILVRDIFYHILEPFDTWLDCVEACLRFV